MLTVFQIGASRSGSRSILERIGVWEDRIGQKFLSQLFVESNPSELCFHIVVLFLAFVSAFAHKKCAKLQKFFDTRKKNFHFARRKGVKEPLGRKIIGINPESTDETGIQCRVNGRRTTGWHPGQWTKFVSCD